MSKGNRVKFKDRKIVQWVKKNAPDLIGDSLALVGDLTGIEMVENLGKKISGSNDLTPEQKAEAAELIKLDLEFEKETTARWSADMMSDSWLSKNVRPVILLYSWLLLTLLCVLAFCGVLIPSAYTSMTEALCIAVNVAYFGSRGIEKYQAIRRK